MSATRLMDGKALVILQPRYSADTPPAKAYVVTRLRDAISEEGPLDLYQTTGSSPPAECKRNRNLAQRPTAYRVSKVLVWREEMA